MHISKKTIGPVELVTAVTSSQIKVQGIYLPCFTPEIQAALGATLSRDPGPAETRLEKLFSNPKIQKRILDIYFKGYGHNSIGDMGGFMFSIEGLSMVGAVEVVENQLFNGQEASTRYIDFESLGYLSVHPEVDELSRSCFYVYEKVKSALMKSLTDEGASVKEAEPQAFDIAGAFLPFSARTNVFWTGSIRTYIGQIRKLKAKNSECHQIGSCMEEITKYICPNSVKEVPDDYYLPIFESNQRLIESGYKKSLESKNGISWASFDFESFYETYNGTQNLVPCEGLSTFGTVNSGFEIDFRSARDIHRHRAFRVNRPVSYTSCGLESYYLDRVPEEIKSEVEDETLSLLEECSQSAIGYYGMPMATKIPYFMSGDLMAWLYYLDLRSGPKVHPTVIASVQKQGQEFEENLAQLNLYRRGGVDYGKRSGDANKV